MWWNVLRRIYPPPLPVLCPCAGNCAPPQDVIKPNSSLFPASIILVLDYPTLSRGHLYVPMYEGLCEYSIYGTFASYISCNYYSSRAVSVSTADSLGELCPGWLWKIEKSISIFVHELYVNSRASGYESGEISHYPVCSLPTENRNFQRK